MIDRRLEWWDIENWPRWLYIAYCVTFPVSGPAILLVGMLFTLFIGPVLILACYYSPRFWATVERFL